MNHLPPLFDPQSYALQSVWAALYLGCGIVAAVFALFVLAKQPGSRIARTLALNIATIVTLMLTTGGMWTTRDEVVAEQIVRPGLAILAFTGPLQCLFTMRLSGFDLRAGWRRFRDLGFGVASAFAVLVVATNLFSNGVARTRFGFALNPGALYGPYLLFYAAYWVASLAPLVHLARHSRTALGRRRALYILTAFGIGGLSVCDGFLVYFKWAFPTAWAASLVATLVLVYAVIQHRLMDISTAIHRTFIRLVISLALFLPLYLLLVGARGSLQTSGPAVLAAVALALFFVSRTYFATVQPWIDRLLARRRLRLERAVAAFQARTAELGSQAALVSDVVDTIDRLLSAAVRAIVVRSEKGWQPLFPREASQLPAPDPSLVETLRVRPEMVALSELGADPERFEQLERSAQRLCDRYGAAVILPLVHRGEFVGVIAIAQPRGERPFTHDEIEFLEKLRTAATVAFVNAQLFEEIERRSTELESEVRARTSELSHKLEEIKRAQADLVQTEKMASLGMLVAGVSHEINNALTFVYGNLPTLRKYMKAYVGVLDGWRDCAQGDSSLAAAMTESRADFIREDTEPLIAAMEEGARRARMIVGDLRGFARHDEALVGVADVRDGLESTLNLLRGGFGTRIVFHRDFAQELPRIECHPAQLNQVFLNLLLNAVESIEGQGEIRIRAEPGDAGGVVVTIIDSGRGIPEGVRARVWEPFFTTKQRRDGAGLGLTICRTIVEKHGGSITLEPSQPHGTRVRVELPRRGLVS